MFISIQKQAETVDFFGLCLPIYEYEISINCCEIAQSKEIDVNSFDKNNHYLH